MSGSAVHSTRPRARSPAIAAIALLVAACGDDDHRPAREAEGPETPYFVGSVEDYPAPAPVTAVPLVADIPRGRDERIREGQAERAAPAAAVARNQAVELRVVASERRFQVGERSLPTDRALQVVDVAFENVHPKQQIERSRLEGKSDRTLGAGGLLRGGGATQDEMVDVDVAYKIPELSSHLYLMADGIAYPLAEPAPGSELLIERQGEVEELRLAAVVPRETRDLALQLLDYAFGHVAAPVQGDVGRARGEGRRPKGMLAEASTRQLEIAARAVDVRQEFAGRSAPSDRRYAVVDLVGKSLSSGADLGNTVEIDPTRYLWVVADGGYLSYAEPLAGSADRPLRFPPELWMHQEVGILVAEPGDRLTLGVRVQDEVVELPLTGSPPELPEPIGRHLDPEVMEVLLFGSRVRGDRVVLDLGIRPLVERQGIELQAAAQFQLLAGTDRLAPDQAATSALLHAPPEPFVIPPGIPVRFELAFTTAEVPSALRVRGFRNEGTIELRR